MAGHTGISPELASMGVESSESRSSHVLALEYPDSDLLPEGRFMPTLIAPHNCGFRERPDGAKYALVDDSADFVLRLPVLSTPSIDQSANQSFFATVARVQETAGRSTLAATTYADRSMDFFYRFRLTTIPIGRSAQPIVLEAELTPQDWAEAQRAFASQPWMQLLTDLLVRASDRAYFHVEARLGAYRAYRADEAKRAGDWGFETLRGPNELLALNLGHPVVSSGGRVGRKVIEDLSKEGNGNEKLIMSCGHEQVVFMPLLKQMSAAVCKIFACKTCGEKSMQEEDLWYLGLWEEMDRRREFFTALDEWKKLDQWHIGRDQRRRVAGPAVQLALEVALEGLWVPETIVPAILCGAKSAAAEAVLEGLKKDFEHLNVQTLNPLELRNRLTQRAEIIIRTRSDVVDGLVSWWLLWTDRAVKLLFLPEDERAAFDAAIGQQQNSSGDLDILLAGTRF